MEFAPRSELLWCGMFTAGSGVPLPPLGGAASLTAIGSLVVLLAAGCALGWWLPDQFLGPDGRRWIFAVFIGIALAISSLPVAARILGDLELLGRPVGQLVMTVAMINEVVGWIPLGLLAGVAETGAFFVAGCWPPAQWCRS